MALHECDNPPCCNPKHLRWGTAKDNADDRDLRKRGVAANAKTDAFTVSEIWRLRLAGYTCGEIAERLHLAKSHAMNIYTGRAWSHLLGTDGNPTLKELRASKPKRKRRAHNQRVTDDLVDYILQSRVSGIGPSLLAKLMNMPVGTISPIYYGLSRTDRHGVGKNPTLEKLQSIRITPENQKLDDDDKIVIRSLIKEGYTGKSIAAEYGVSPALVSRIKNEKR